MKKHFAAAVLLLLLTSVCHSQLPMNQERFADSLTNIIRNTSSDSTKARMSFLLIYYWSPRDTAKARQYLEQGRTLGRPYPFLRAISYAHEAYLYYATDADRSQAAFLRSDTLLSSFKTKDAYIARSNIWNNIAVLHQRKDDDRTYTDIVLNKAIPFGLLAHDSALVGSQYVGLGIAFMNLTQYDKAEIYFNKAIDMLSHTPGISAPSRIAAAYCRMGENYMLQKKIPEAKRVLDTLKVLLKPYPGSELYSGYYMIEGLYYHEKKLYNLAIASFDQGIAAAAGSNKQYRISELQFYKTTSFIDNRQYKEALRILETLSKDEEVMSLDDSRLELYNNMAKAYAGLGQMPAAYSYVRQYSQLNDSLHEKRVQLRINDMEITYQSREKQKEIVVLKAKSEQAALSAKNNKLLTGLLATAFLLLLIITIFTLLYYRNKRKLSEQKEINYQQQLHELEQSQQLATTEAMLEGEERERRRMARDLHDGLGGMLAGIKIKLSGQVKKETAAPGSIEKVMGQLDNSITELRRIARNMMPESLLRFGLQTALKDLCESLISTQTNISFEAYDIDEHMDLSRQIVIYRIIQETLSNAVRHAAARNILLQCSQNKHTFFITVEDDGNGFDLALVEKSKKGIGLSNIENRVKYLKGRMEISSMPGEGATINIELNVAA